MGRGFVGARGVTWLADLGVGDRKLWRALAWSDSAHELLAHELFLKKSQYG